jgi:triosephosphate isomerase
MAKPLLAGNWKMHGTEESTRLLAGRISAGVTSSASAPEIVIFPSLVHLPAVIDELEGKSGIAVGAQNCSQHTQGAFTGEVSAQMLVDIGCSHVLVGHSERRVLYAETNEQVAEKFAVAQSAGLIPILCVGETLIERQQGQTVDVVRQQIAEVAKLVGIANICQAVVAYEPVWAIGTGETATPQQAQEVHADIRAQLGDQGISTPLLYGGSVNADNAYALFAQPDIDGGLVGGASLEAQQFLEIAQQITEQK